MINGIKDIYGNMDDKLEQLKLQKLLQEYSFLNLDYQYKTELIEKYRGKFMDEVGENKPPSQPQEQPNTPPKDAKVEPKIKNEDLDPKTKDKIKKIYREISKKTHPDKVDSEELLDIYIQAKTAYELNDLMELFLICGKLNIQVEMDMEDTSTLDILIELKKNEITRIESSFIWMYINAKNDEIRHNLIKQFVEKHGKKI